MSDHDWARLGFREEGAAYGSGSQKARIWTEGWMEAFGFCPRCGAERLRRSVGNAKAKDFACTTCDETFELKSGRKIGRIVPDGAYETMVSRMGANDSPNLFVMRYDAEAREVRDLIGVPRQFFVPSVIIKRKPLAPTARRAGWVGCNIAFDQIPAMGRVTFVRDGKLSAKSDVIRAWNATRDLARVAPDTRGWLMDVLWCVEQIERTDFDLADVYAFEGQLKAIYPGNNNVRPKIRQQLQVLRDAGLLQFLGRGAYRFIGAGATAR